MRTRLAAAVVAALVAIPLTAATAAASPEHKCEERAGGIAHKCDDSKT